MIGYNKFTTITALLLFFAPAAAFAIIYQPGATLNPDCAPTDVNCGVTPIAGGNIIPDADAAYDIGSATRQWRDLYLSGNTLHIGGFLLSAASSTGALVWSGSSIETTPSVTSTSELKLSELSTNGLEYVGLKAPASVATSTLWILPAFDGLNGQALSTNGGGALSWITPLTSAVASLNGLATSTQSFAVDTTGMDFNIVSSGSTHTFNIPTASSTARGLLSSTDWSIFNNKENAIVASSTATYYRGDKTFQTLDTSAVPENGNLYFTNTRFDSALGGKTTTDLSEGLNLYYTDARFDSRFAAKTTSNLVEGLNLYFTNARARGALSVSAPLSYNSTTGVFGIAQSSLTSDGYLSSTDWNTFNNKLGTALGSGLIWIGNASNVAAPIAISGDAAISNGGVLTISSGAIDSGKILDAAISTLDLTDGLVTTVKIADSSVTLAKLAADSVDASKITDGAITSADISATAGITNSQLASSTIGLLLGITGTDVNVFGTPAALGGALTLNIPDAGATARGLVTTGAQTFAGDKTFSGASTFATTTASSLTLSPMTQGSLLFAGTGGLVSQNSTNLFWDNANNRLGVGAASPNARLYVKTSDLTSTPFYVEGQDNAFTGLSGWFYRKPIVIDNTANSAGYSNQQVFVSIDTAGLISAGKLQSDCADLRFTNADGTTILPHWVEYGCNSAGTGVWVKIPTLPAGITKTIYAYYGNPSATSTSSGAGVFTFFDDFPTNQARFYNTEYPNWTVQTGSWIIPSGNYLANYYGGDMITVNSSSAGIGAAVRAKMTEAAAWKYARLLIGWQDANNYYAATLNSGGGQLNIQKVVGGTQTTLSNINASVAAGTWYEVELRWVSSTVIEAQIWDASGNSLGVAQGVISEGWTGGKFGAHGVGGTSTARFENYMTLQYAPNISSSIGAEENSGAPQQFPFFVVKNQTGKIGIGEANPGAKLSVSGGLAIGSDFDTTSVSDGNAIFSGRLGVGVISPSNALTFAASSVIDSQGALSITTASDGALSLVSNGSGNIVIDSGASGALNIGAGANGKTITLGNTTGATGLVFNSGSGNINFDSSTLYVDTVNNRVGVGTSTPAGTLHVANASSANALVVASSGNVGIGLSNPTDTLNIYGGLKTESTVGTIMAAGSDGAFAYNFGSGISNSLSKRIAQSSDDAEQNLTTGSVNLTSSDLELINDNGVDQEVGMRFQNITIPQGATITNAYIEFTADTTDSGTTNLNFYGEAADNATVFAAATNNITSRTKTSATVAWSAVPAWTIGQTQQTPNLTSIIQEIINRAGWLSGNSLAIIVDGTAGSLRKAVSYNGGASSAPLLVVQYTTSSTNVSYAINNLGPGLFRINDEFNDVSPFVVDSSGNVGIGTSTPSQKFHVSGGNIKLDWDKAIVWRNAADSADAEVIRVTGINPNQNSLNLTIPGGPAADPSNARFVISADGSFYFRNNTPTDIMRLTSAGSLGIGTASPGAKFHIIGDNNTAGFLFDIADIGATVPFKIAGTDAGTASTVLSSTVLTNNTTGGNQNVMLIENAAGSGVTDALLKLNNADTDTAVVDGLIITSANGFITDAIDVSGANITNAINIGGNKIVGDSLSIDGDGNVGIGTTTPAQLLHVARSTDGVVARFTDANGDCDINPTDTALVCASDASLKKNILTLDNSLEKVLALNPVTFNWNGEKDDAATHLGFIAQEVEVLFPALVSTNEDGLKSIAYSNFTPILTKAIQEVTSLANSFKINLIAWFSDTTNGITDFFAKKIHTEQICLKKSDGNEYCVNGDDLEAIMGGREEAIIMNQESIENFQFLSRRDISRRETIPNSQSNSNNQNSEGEIMAPVEESTENSEFHPPQEVTAGEAVPAEQPAAEQTLIEQPAEEPATIFETAPEPTPIAIEAIEFVSAEFASAETISGPIVETAPESELEPTIKSGSILANGQCCEDKPPADVYPQETAPVEFESAPVEIAPVETMPAESAEIFNGRVKRGSQYD